MDTRTAQIADLLWREAVEAGARAEMAGRVMCWATREFNKAFKVAEEAIDRLPEECSVKPEQGGESLRDVVAARVEVLQDVNHGFPRAPYDLYKPGG